MLLFGINVKVVEVVWIIIFCFEELEKNKIKKIKIEFEVWGKKNLFDQIDVYINIFSGWIYAE